MKSAVAFETLFETALKPLLEPLEKQRKAFLKKFWTVVIFTVGLTALFGFLSAFANLFIGIVIFISGCLICRRLYKNFKKNYTPLYKSEIISKLIQSIDNRLDYSPDYGISQKAFQRSEIFPQAVSRYMTEDYIEGTIGQTVIAFAEVHAQQEIKDSEGSRTHQDLFRGLFFTADFNKRFTSKTVIVPDLFGDSWGRVGRFLQKKGVWGGSYPLVKLEDPAFEKYFAVYGTDQVEARYILSPALMSRILKFKMENGYIWLSFVDGNLFLALPLKANLFEPRIFRSVSDPEPLKKYVRYVNLMVSIVEELNLNLRIWAK